jgi:hypothetical protein
MRALRVFILAAMVIGYTGVQAFAMHGSDAMDMSHNEGMKEDTFTKHYDNSIFKVTEKGLYSVELLIKGGMFVVGSNSMDIIVHDRYDKDVTGAKITITPWMPDMGHGVPQAPEIIERGGGRYTAEQVNASMPGLWELRFTIDASSGTDTAVFGFPDVIMREGMDMEGMDHSHGMEGMSGEGMGAKEGVNYSHTLTSEKGLFTVSYEPQYKDIPVGKIHQWQLDIADKDGNPVEGADIEVSGLMPAHGHGLPTSPEVTPEEGGIYLIEGMEFSMPGYWTVTVKITRGGVEDHVTFNLNLK